MPTLLLENAPFPQDEAWIVPPDPKRDKPGGPKAWRIAPAASEWLVRAQSNINASPAILQPFSAVDQSASIIATDLSGGALSAGLYELRYWITKVVAAGGTSSLTVTFSWTYRGISQGVSGAALTVDAAGTNQTGSAPLFYSDAASPITIDVTYASNPPATMTFDCYAFLLKVQA